MRKAQKEQILEMISTLGEAHAVIKNHIENKEFDTGFVLLEDCQQAAISIGGLIEETEGEDHSSVRTLEQYCDRVYQVGQGIAEDDMSAQKAYQLLHKSLIQVENSVEKEVSVRLEVVFLPYKASMWDSLESVWKAADEDPDCDAYVIPIPYYDKNPDFSFGAFHYEGDQFPKDVPITHYEAYSLEGRRPDVIYIHNPYDGGNCVTSIDPRFYSSKLKEYTEMLVYIPYFVMDEKTSAEKSEIYAATSAVMNADKVIVQSETVRQAYINALLKHVGDTPCARSVLEGKILGIGSPKFDAIQIRTKETYDIPDSWKETIGDKKVILYDTHLNLLMRHAYKRFLPKLRSVLEFFKNRTDVVLLWRPHPLMISTARSMNPDALAEYMEIVEEFRNGGWGIYDDTPDMDRAIAISDAFYGSNSSILVLYRITGKPVLIHNIDVRTEVI